MSQQVKIERDLVFRENAQHTGNVRGRFSLANMVYWYDDFTGKAIDIINDYTFQSESSGTATIVVPHALKLYTDSGDDDDCEFAMGVEWYGEFNAVIEARVMIEDIANVGVNIGFNDSQQEGANDVIAFMLSGPTPTLTKATVDAACFVADKDCSTYGLFACSVKGGAAGSIIATGITPTNTMWMTLRVELQDNGTTTNAAFYANSSGLEINPATDLVGFELDAVTRDTALCPYFAIINHDGGNDDILVDYIKVWQDRY